MTFVPFREERVPFGEERVTIADAQDCMLLENNNTIAEEPCGQRGRKSAVVIL